MLAFTLIGYEIDFWIFLFSMITVVATVAMGFWSAGKSKTAGDFFVAGRSVSVGWNASAISGEYLSAASFMGVAGMVMKFGYDALWYPVCYACGYLFLLLFIAGPLRRFGAYTIPDFAEGRYDSTLFRKIAVVFVLFIGFFYTMPQMKGAGTTLAYIFPGLPYWVGVAVVGALITLNVALGGMKGITLVQAFQYWLKMFAISLPVFVLLAVYGGYGEQVGKNGQSGATLMKLPAGAIKPWATPGATNTLNLDQLLIVYARNSGGEVFRDGELAPTQRSFPMAATNWSGAEIEAKLREENVALAAVGGARVASLPEREAAVGVATARAGWNERARIAPPSQAPADKAWVSPFGPLTSKAAARAGLSVEEQRPYSLLYTYSLIVAIVCGTAGLPHILVRFYTNPDGAAAKRTTMWVMILIGVFYLFPPILGALGRNLVPDLYAAAAAQGTDTVVLQLPRLLNAKVPMLGSILSGIACAGAFAAFMSTFSGLLVSMTGALAHDVYGRILRPKSSPGERMVAFKVSAVVIGVVAILLGTQVEKLDINFMVGQAFAIAAASYFPLLFMSAWWRGMTTKGAATGMLGGGLAALACITLTSFSDLGFLPGMAEFWKSHPLVRILCEQPAIWAVPLSITLMIVVSKLTRREVPADVRMKMLVLHAPESLGLKQEYIQEHTPHGH